MTWTILLLLPRHEVDESEDEGEEEGVAERERGRESESPGNQLSKEVQNFMTN